MSVNIEQLQQFVDLPPPPYPEPKNVAKCFYSWINDELVILSG